MGVGDESHFVIQKEESAKNAKRVSRPPKPQTLRKSNSNPEIEEREGIDLVDEALFWK